MNTEFPLHTGDTVTLPVKELTPKEQLQADLLYLKGRPAPFSYRKNGSVIAPLSMLNIGTKKERSHRRRTLKRKER